MLYSKENLEILSSWMVIIASHYIEVELLTGESKDFVFMFGYVEVTPEDKWKANW